MVMRLIRSDVHHVSVTGRNMEPYGLIGLMRHLGIGRRCQFSFGGNRRTPAGDAILSLPSFPPAHHASPINPDPGAARDR